MTKYFLNMSTEQLAKYLQGKGYEPSRPLLLSIDGDKTIVNRDQGAHFISSDVKKIFKDLQEDTRFIVSMNTGRDRRNYLPIQLQNNHAEPNIFLAGRAIYYDDTVITPKEAILSKELQAILWKKFTSGELGFLDIKTADDNLFFISSSRNLHKLLGHHRPKGWFDNLEFNAIDIDTDPAAEEKYLSLDILRAEIPFTKTQNAALLKTINGKDREALRNSMHLFFEDIEVSDINFIPAPTNRSHDPHYIDQVASVRIVTSERLVNKGTGLKVLADALNVPYQNIVFFGDSAEDKANDAIVKTILPECTLIITDNGEENAKKYADFITDNVASDGVPKAIKKLIRFQDNHSLL
jgi:hydroxymethylpyrimidine pyrophosphatase-like HAD family hydrolase